MKPEKRDNLNTTQQNGLVVLKKAGSLTEACSDPVEALYTI